MLIKAGMKKRAYHLPFLFLKKDLRQPVTKYYGILKVFKNLASPHIQFFGPMT